MCPRLAGLQVHTWPLRAAHAHANSPPPPADGSCSCSKRTFPSSRRTWNRYTRRDALSLRLHPTPTSPLYYRRSNVFDLSANQVTKLCGRMVEAGQAYSAANQLFLSSLTRLPVFREEPSVVTVRARSARARAHLSVPKLSWLMLTRLAGGPAPPAGRSRSLLSASSLRPV